MFVLPRIGVGSGRVVRGYLGTVANGDPSWTDDRSLHDPLGLFVHYTDGVAFRATVDCLATQRENDARHLVDQCHGFATLNEIRLHQFARAQGSAGLQICTGGKSDDLRPTCNDVAANFTARPPIHLNIRIAQNDTAFQRPCDCGNFGRWYGAAGQSYKTRPAPVCGDFQRCIETAAAGVEIYVCDTR